MAAGNDLRLPVLPMRVGGLYRSLGRHRRWNRRRVQVICKPIEFPEVGDSGESQGKSKIRGALGPRDNRGDFPGSPPHREQDDGMAKRTTCRAAATDRTILIGTALVRGATLALGRV